MEKLINIEILCTRYGSTKIECTDDLHYGLRYQYNNDMVCINPQHILWVSSTKTECDDYRNEVGKYFKIKLVDGTTFHCPAEEKTKLDCIINKE